MRLPEIIKISVINKQFSLKNVAYSELFIIPKNTFAVDVRMRFVSILCATSIDSDNLIIKGDQLRNRTRNVQLFADP